MADPPPPEKNLAPMYGQGYTILMRHAYRLLGYSNAFVGWSRVSEANQGVYIIRWDFNEGFLFHVAHRKYLQLDGARIR
jgi:hypothetical protein